MASWFGKCDICHFTIFIKTRILNQMNKFILPTFSFLLLATIGCQNKVESTKLTKIDIVESVYASAKIKAENQYSQRLTIGGKLIKYLVNEGDLVMAGQPIALLENISPELSVKNAEMALQITEENHKQLNELSLQTSSAKNQMTFDSINYKKQFNLFKKDIGTQNQLDALKLKYETSKNLYLGIKDRLEAQRQIVKRSKEQARNNLDIARKNNSDFTITSYIDGKVYSLPYKIGETVVPQQEFAIIGNATKFYLEMEIDEAEISKIQLGQKIIVKLEAYPDVFNARISNIHPALDNKTQSFKIEGVFEGQTPVFYPGLTAEANIITNTKKDALVIPLTYLIDNKYVKTASGNVEVKTGLKNFSQVEILSGIDNNTEILKP